MRRCFLALIPFAAMLATAASANGEPARQLFHNEDATNFFFFQTIPDGKAGEVIDRYVDVMADAGVTVYLCNTNCRRTNYDSHVWEPYWGEYDPAKPDDQPFLAAVPRHRVAAYRNMIANMLAVHRQGIDYPARIVQRCRHRGISPWITLRMNDCHNNDIPNYPSHGSLWKKHPELARKNCPGYFATCLDYAHREVRDHYMALIVETLERYDIDGLELDFLREPYLFSAGKETEGAPILTAWIRDVRKQTEDAAARRGHPIRLGVRVPSRPETALALGLDAVGWAKAGLIDLLVVAPRWATLEFDMPLDEWRNLLATSKTALAGGLEINYRPYPSGKASPVTPELAAGAAVSVLSRGADAVYLFNYFQGNDPARIPAYQDMLKAMTSLDALQEKPRCVGITYRDVLAPGEQYQAPLPATGTEITLPVRLGPIPSGPRVCELSVGLTASNDASRPLPAVSVNGKPCNALGDGVTENGLCLLSFSVPMAALSGMETHQVKVLSKNQKPLTVTRLEMSLRKSAEGGAGND